MAPPRAQVLLILALAGASLATFAVSEENVGNGKGSGRLLAEGPMLAAESQRPGSWNSGYGLHASQGFLQRGGINLPALSQDKETSWMGEGLSFSKATGMQGHSQVKSGKTAQGSWIVPTIAREVEGDGSTKNYKVLAGAAKQGEARSVADVVADEFVVPISKLGGSDKEFIGARGDEPLQVNGRRKVRQPSLAGRGGEYGDEGVREGTPEPEAPPPPPPPPQPRVLPAPRELPPPEPREEFDFRRYFLLDVPLHLWAWLLALFFVLIVWFIASYMMMLHMRHYVRPNVQKYIVRMLLMAPIYSTTAFISLTYYNLAPYVNLIRDGYLAFTIYNFLRFVMEVLGGERAVIKQLVTLPQRQLPFPLHWTDPWKMGFEMLYNCKFGAIQYVVIIPVCGIVTFVAAVGGVYDGVEWYTVDFWVELVTLMTSVWAIYCFVTFFSVAREIFVDVPNANNKLLSVMAVVFLGFFQGLLLRVILAISTLPETMHWSAQLMIVAAEQWLIIIEMVAIAIAMNINFPVEEYSNESESLLRSDDRDFKTRSIGRKTISVFV